MNNKETIIFYNKIVNDYYCQNKENKTIEKQRDFFCSLLNGKNILDAGSGFGRDTFYFDSVGMNTLGIDASIEMLKKAKELYPSSSFKNMNLLSRDLRDLPKYDGIWCCASLVHFEPQELRKVIEDLLYILNENGVLYCSIKTDIKMYSYIEGQRWFQVYTKEYLDGLFSEFGLEVILYEENISPKGQVFSSYFLKNKH